MRRLTVSKAFSDRFLQWTLGALLVFSPLAFGAVEVWSIATAQLLVLAMGVVWIARMISQGRMEFLQTSMNAPILLLLALILVQTIPLPLSAIRYLSPAAYKVYGAVQSALDLRMGWRTISLDPISTREELLKVLSYAILFWVILNNVRRRRQIEQILGIFIASGFFLAVFGIMQNYSWNGKIYWMREVPTGSLPFGPYVNRNHFAGYMEIVIPLTIGYLMAHSPLRTGAMNMRQRFLMWTSDQTSKSVLLIFAAMFMAASLLLTTSRGGLVSFIGSMVFFAAMMRLKRTPRPKGSRLLLAVASLGLIAAVWVGGNSAFLSVERLGRGIQEPSTEQRIVVWRDTLRMARDYVGFGSGLNTFEQVYPMYKSLPVQIVFQHAHNDYLQLLAEGGVVALCLVIWIIVAWYREASLTWLEREDPFATYMTLAGMASVFAMLIHSLTDFNLRIPANAFALVTVLAVTLNTVRVRPPGQLIGSHEGEA